MSPAKLAVVALDRVRTALHKPAPDLEAEPSTLASPTFLQQEPDLVKETGLHNRQSSGWAAGGTPD